MLKVAVDIEREVLSIDCELHIDCAEQLKEEGSEFQHIWGANVYPEKRKIDFTAVLNIRPERGNRSMEIQDETTKQRVDEIIHALLPL